jgi:tetratricopeptide (TPR) repeat protein
MIRPGQLVGEGSKKGKKGEKGKKFFFCLSRSFCPSRLPPHKLLLAFSFTLLLAAAMRAQEPSDDLATALAEARALISAGNPKAAIGKLQALPAVNDTSGDMSAAQQIAHLLGVAYYHDNDYANAVKRLTPVADKLPKNSLAQREATQILGLSHYLLGRLKEAIPYLERAGAFAPDDHEMAYVLGMACIQTRQYDKGRAAFARMFGAPADSPAAYLLNAQMMIRAELNEPAESELKQALLADARLPQANYLLAQVALFRGRLDEGVELLEREIAVNPGNANAYYKLGDAYTRQARWDEAVAALQKSVWLNPYYSGPYILLGKSYLRRRQLANAERMLKRAIQFDPNNKSAHYLLGQVHHQSGRVEEAKREFAITEKLPGNP